MWSFSWGKHWKKKTVVGDLSCFENPWLWRWVYHSGCQSPTAVICRAGLKLLSTTCIFEVEAHYLKCTKHVLDEQHPSSVANTNEPLVGVI